MPKGTRSQTGREEKQAAILSAALELFAEQGFHATNVPLIAQKAGVSVGTLYHYFENKEAVVNALYRKLKLEMSQAINADFPATAPTPEIFRELWQRTTAYAMANPLSFRFLELHHHAAYLDEKSRLLDEQIRASKSKLLEAGRRTGALKPVPNELLAAFIGGALRALVASALQGRITLTPAVIDQAAACCWNAIRQ